MPFAAALSEHPEAPEAVGEVVGAVFERLGQTPDLAVLFLSPHHVDRADEIASAVRALLRPRVLLGCTASAVVVPVAIYPACRTLWTAVHLGMQPLEPEEQADAAAFRFERGDAGPPPDR